MRYPEFLKDRGTIGFVAPSMGCTTEPYRSAFDNAIKRFHSMGYKTIEGPNCRCDSGIGISNTPKKCAEELNESYASVDSDVLISCGGGELMCEVVPYIDFERVKQSKPKWYMGYSDNTNFTFLEATIADTAGIYGPCAGSFGMEVWHESLTDAFNLLCGRKLSFTNYPMWEKESIKDENAPFVGYNLTEKSCISSIPAVAKESRLTMRGRLLGGCMDCLINLLGTSFDHVREFNERYSDDGIIWFLEACDLNVMGMRRAMWQMKNAGWFSNVKGFLIGRPAHHQNCFILIAGCPFQADSASAHMPFNMGKNVDCIRQILGFPDIRLRDPQFFRCLRRTLFSVQIDIFVEGRQQSLAAALADRHRILPLNQADRFFLDPARLFRRLDRILLLLSPPVRQTKGFQRALLTERTSARDADKRAQLNPCLIIFTWMK